MVRYRKTYLIAEDPKHNDYQSYSIGRREYDVVEVAKFVVFTDISKLLWVVCCWTVSAWACLGGE
jgi:hypothetical protein